MTVGRGKANDHPVYGRTWYEVIKWCNARSEKDGLEPVYSVNGAVMRTGTAQPTANWTAKGYRLPTEAEWEKAARGGLNAKWFPWGDTISHSQANYYSTSWYANDVSPTLAYHPQYKVDSTPYTSPVASFAPNGYRLFDMMGNVREWCWDLHGSYASGAQPDPKGSTTGSHRVIRGGSWSLDATRGRVAYRDYDHHLSTGDGFRLARGL